MEIKIPKEVRDYHENIFFGLNTRQFICSVLATPANPKMHPVNFLPVSFSFRTIKHDIRIAIKFPKPVMIPPFTPDVCATPI